MKRLIQWLAEVFNAEITKTAYVPVETVKYIYDGDVVKGDLIVEGNLVIEGSLEVYGSVTAKGSVSAHGVKSRIECLKK